MEPAVRRQGRAVGTTHIENHVIDHERQVEAPLAPGYRATIQSSPGNDQAADARSPVESLRLEGLHKSFGACRAVDGVTLEVREGELLAILGPSGCGKSTLLRVVAGLERQDAGRVVLHGRDVGTLPPAARGCGVVFQSYALFPNLSARENVAFGIDRRRYRRRRRAERALELLGQVGLWDAAGRYPAQLSGGQQQRVALARALATEPSLLLLDEPLSALDAKVRAMLRVEIRRLQQSTRLTTLLVTHDQEEAMTMADRVAVMNAGRLVQVDSPRAVYQRPADAFTAAFVGVMNFVDGWTVASGRTLRRGGLELTTVEEPTARVGERVTAAFRPEEAALERTGAPGPRENVLRSRVDRVEFRGPFVRHYLSLDPGQGEAVVVDVPMRDAARLELSAGDVANLHVPPASVRVFPDAGAAR
jgi:iron(III) transport system ATP-binding protein